MNKKLRNNWFVKHLFFGGRPDWVKEENVIWATKLEYDNKGFHNIKVGDKFEGAACGNWFGDQTCTDIQGEYVYGTTTLVVFKKEHIRPIIASNKPPELLQYSKYGT